MTPAEARTSEKVLNGALAAALNGCHPRWRVEAEQSGVVRGAPGRSPDLVITAGDGPAAAPVVIETEYEPARTVEADAAARLGAVLSRSGQTVEQAVAVAVPEALSRAPQRDLPGEIEAAGLRYRLVTRYGAAAGQSWFPSEGWRTGAVADLAGLCEQLTTNDLVVESAATVMEDSVAAVSNNLARAFSDKPQVLAGVAAALNLQPSEQTTRIGVTMIANALLFQLAIEGGVNPETGWRIPGPSAEAPRDRVLEVWWRILDVNYWPIFWTAHAVLSQIPQAEAHAEVLAPLTGMAHKLARFGTASTADIAGQMFGKLIADRKFLATFYTRPSSARLLAELAVDRLAVDWSDPERVESLRVADLACGTGSLLTAAYQQIASRVRRIGGLDDEALHPAMMEQVLAGADIMPAAAHLTCTALSSTHPRTRFSQSRIHLMPYGRSPDASGSGHHVRLGALELLDRSYRQTSWLDTAEIAVDPEGGAGNGAEPVAGRGANGAEPAAGRGANGPEPVIDHAGADLVIMNPPFTRPTNHGTAEAARVPVPSFAGFDTEAAEQRAMSRRLAKLNRGLADPAGSGNAGLASNFVDLAHAKVKPGGAIAFVLPAVMTAGQAWSKVRALLDEHYRNICVVAIADTGPTDRSFSADTGMAEVLVVADRARPDDEPDPDSWLWVNLSARPPNPVEAAETARLIARIASEPPHRRSGALNLGGARIGNYVRDGVGAAGCAGIAEPDLAVCAGAIASGRLWLGRLGLIDGVRLTELGELGSRGPVDRDVSGVQSDRITPRGPFDIEKTDDWRAATYPVLWFHDHRRETRLVVEPDCQGRVRDGCEDKALRIWASASRLHFSLDFRLNSQPLAACLTPEPCVGGRAWPAFKPDDERWATAVLLWANTTLGLISFWWAGTRQQQGRSNLTVLRLPELAALDPRALTDEQLSAAAGIFDRLADKRLLPANEAWRDETRQELDRMVLADLLGLDAAEVMPALAVLRYQWCLEPSVHGGKATRPSNGAAR